MELQLAELADTLAQAEIIFSPPLPDLSLALLGGGCGETVVG